LLGETMKKDKKSLGSGLTNKKCYNNITCDIINEELEDVNFDVYKHIINWSRNRKEKNVHNKLGSRSSRLKIGLQFINLE
jgi:hypothetical protein